MHVSAVELRSPSATTCIHSHFCSTRCTRCTRCTVVLADTHPSIKASTNPLSSPPSSPPSFHYAGYGGTAEPEETTRRRGLSTPSSYESSEDASSNRAQLTLPRGLALSARVLGPAILDSADQRGSGRTRPTEPYPTTFSSLSTVDAYPRPRPDAQAHHQSACSIRASRWSRPVRSSRVPDTRDRKHEILV